MIRDARVDDATALLAIYEPSVTESAVSFELVPPTEAEFAARIERYRNSHAWLVAEEDGTVAGYAYGTPHRARAAYRFSAETSVYVDARFRRRGVAARLYDELFARLAARGYYQAYAGVTLPNPASEAFHEAAGFRRIGVFPVVGYKFGRWCDVAWWHRPLRDDEPDESADQLQM